MMPVCFDFRRVIPAGLVAVLLLLLVGCSTLSYYSQALSGQVELLNKRRPISAVINDPQVDAVLRGRLRLIEQARAFAERELNLPANGSYSDYADLGRPYALWNVFVTPAYSLQPLQWCHPFVGCIAYRNYFSRQAAQDYADGMQAQGFDVYVAGVPAYSTLGWFDDPVMNTMMHWQDYDLVGTLFHELTHQKFYIPGDTVFNESLARTIEQEGLRRWMQQQQDSAQYQQYLLDAQRERQFIRLVLQTRKRLEALYQSGRSGRDMYTAKLDQFRQLRREYLQLRQQWGGYEGYDNWILSGVNNAKVQSIATYHDYVPAFQHLLEQQQGDLQAFYRRITEVIVLDDDSRRRYLLGLVNDRSGRERTDAAGGSD